MRHEINHTVLGLFLSESEELARYEAYFLLDLGAISSVLIDRREALDLWL